MRNLLGQKCSIPERQPAVGNGTGVYTHSLPRVAVARWLVGMRWWRHSGPDFLMLEATGCMPEATGCMPEATGCTVQR